MGALRRLQITCMTAKDYLGGITAALTVVGAFSILLTYLTAWALGFHSQGSLWAALLIGLLANISVIGVGLIVASFSRTVSQAFVIANFPLGLMMFFSGSAFPVPPLVLFTIGGRQLALFDLLPATHAVTALNKIFTQGAGIRVVAFELVALTLLSAGYFAIGAWFFHRRHLKPA